MVLYQSDREVRKIIMKPHEKKEVIINPSSFLQLLHFLEESCELNHSMMLIESKV